LRTRYFRPRRKTQSTLSSPASWSKELHQWQLCSQQVAGIAQGLLDEQGLVIASSATRALAAVIGGRTQLEACHRLMRLEHLAGLWSMRLRCITQAF